MGIETRMRVVDEVASTKPLSSLDYMSGAGLSRVGVDPHS